MKKYNNANSILGKINLPLPLSSEEEARLLNSLSTNPEARNILIERNLRLVIYIAKKFENTGVSIGDLVSIGTLGLIKAIDTFSIDKNVKLPTYASRCIENEILMFLRKSKKFTNHIVSLDSVLSMDTNGNEFTLRDIISDENTSNFVEVCESTLTNREHISFLLTFALNCLSYKEAIVIFYKLGGKTQEEIGKAINISQSYISKLYKIAQLKLKNSLQTTKTDFTQDIIFSMTDENSCKIGFSVNVFGNNEIFLSFLTDIKFQVTNDEYIWIKMPLTEQTFIGIAELMIKLKLKN